MSVNKSKISKAISLEIGITEEESKRFVNTFFEIKKFLLKDKNLKISKFGSFSKRISPKRIGRNPKTLEEFIIPKQSKISFKASKKIKDIIN